MRLIGKWIIITDATFFTFIILAYADSSPDKSLAMTIEAVIVIEGGHHVVCSKLDFILGIADDIAYGVTILIKDFDIDVVVLRTWRIAQTGVKADVEG